MKLQYSSISGLESCVRWGVNFLQFLALNFSLITRQYSSISGSEAFVVRSARQLDVMGLARTQPPATLMAD
jgi:hypothetical protein